MDDNTKTTLSKLSNFFDKFPQIDWNEYFGAPRSLHPEEACPYIEFFLSRAAIKTYNLFKEKQELDKPEKQMEAIQKGAHFVGMHCLKSNILVEKYLEQKDGLMPVWTKHLREHNITPYNLFEIGDVMSAIYNMQDDEKSLYLGDYAQKFGEFKTKYQNSTEVKTYIKAATKKIAKFVEIHLKK